MPKPSNQKKGTNAPSQAKATPDVQPPTRQARAAAKPSGDSLKKQGDKLGDVVPS